LLLIHECTDHVLAECEKVLGLAANHCNGLLLLVDVVNKVPSLFVDDRRIFDLLSESKKRIKRRRIRFA